MLFLTPDQQCQCTEGRWDKNKKKLKFVVSVLGFYVTLFRWHQLALLFASYGHPIEYSRPLCFCPLLSIFLSFYLFFPRLISAVGDWMSTILLHMVWL